MAQKPKKSKIVAGASQKSVATHIDVSQQRVAQFVRDGIFAVLVDGKLNVDACRAAYIGWLRDESRKSSAAAATGRMQDIRTREIELRIEERTRKHLVAAQAEAVAIIDEFAGQLRADIEAIPARLTTDLTLRQRMEREIDEAFGAAGDRAMAAAALIDPPRPLGTRRARRAAASGRRQP